jgi:ribonuclease-3
MEKTSRTKSTDLTELEQLIGYHFKNQKLLEEAITTSSYSKEHPESPDYQSLEFLGDRVISLILAEELCAEESLDEGRMTVLKSELENNQRLAEYGEEIGLRNYIRAGEQRENISSKVIADVFEAICGAIYWDSERLQRMKEVEKFLRKFQIFERLKEQMATVKLPIRNRFENKFREINRYNPDMKFTYRSSGEEHQKRWKIEICSVKVPQTGEYVEFKGVKSDTDKWFHTKKDAETDAIEQAYKYMEEKGWELEHS